MSVLLWESVQNLTDPESVFIRRGGGLSIVTVGTPYGDKAVELSNTGDLKWQLSDTPQTEFWFSFFFGATTNSDLGEPRIEFWQGDIDAGGTRQFYLRPDGSGTAGMALYVLHLHDATGALVGTSNDFSRGPFGQPENLTHVEIYVNTTTGVVKVWMDDSLEFDETGMDIQAIAGGIDWLRIEGPNNGFTAEQIQFSHFVLQDADGGRLGQHQVVSEVPDSEVAVQFTPTGAASNWQALATSDGDTSYNESSTDGHRDRLGFADPGMTRNPFFVGARVTAKQTAAGNSKLLIGMRDGVDEDLSAALDIQTIYKTVGYLTEMNPATGDPWLTSELDDVELVYELELDTPAVRVTLARLEFLDRLVAPERPTISVDSIGKTTLGLSGSVFVGPGGTTHAASQWQVADVTDGGYTAPYFDSGEDATNLLSITATGLPSETDVRARVRYLNNIGLWSEWSLNVFATTLAGPAKPVVTIDSTGPDFIELSISTYVPGSSGAAQESIVYQITDVSDPLFLTPIVDYTSTFDEEFTGKTFFGLNLFLNQYLIRVMVTDVLGEFSEWSDTAGPTGLATTGQFYTPFGERELGFRLRLANWDEVVEVDGESTWTNLTDPDAICLVVSRREIVTGSPDGIDPIRWLGFPDVDKQIVWTRIKFDEVGPGPNPCPSSDPGTSSPNGIICRITEGLESFDDFSDPALTGWRVVRSGLGAWGHYPNRGAASHQDRTETVGKHALGYQHVQGDSPDALIMWDAVGIVDAGKFVQIRMKILYDIGSWFSGPWAGIALAAQNDDDQYSAQTRHRCGIFSTHTYTDWWKHTVAGTGVNPIPTYASQNLLISGVLAYMAGRGTYEYLKASIVPAGVDGLYGNYEMEASPTFGNRRGFLSEHRVALDAEWKDGQVGIVVQDCGPNNFGTDGQGLVLFDFAGICTNDIVTVQGLPEGWVLRIGVSTFDNAFWFDRGVPGQPKQLTGDAAVADKTIDFKGHAYPYDTLYLYDDEGSLVETWDVGDNALGEPGIWGGDVYRINVGGVGVGPIGGISLRTRETAIPGDARLTEDDDTRITEDGDIRITE